MNTAILRLLKNTRYSSIAAWKFLCMAFALLLVANASALIANVTPGTALTPVTNTTSINFTYTAAAASVTEQSTQAFLCTTVPTFNQSGGAFPSGPTPFTPNSFCLNTQAAAPGTGTINLAGAVPGGETFTMTPAAFTGLYDGVGGYATVYFVRPWFDKLSLQTFTVSRLQLVPTLIAAPDTLTVAAGGSADVLANDFIDVLNASATNVVLSIVSNGGLTGLSVASAQLLVPNNANARTYTVTYRICDAAPGGATNCVNGTASLTVTAVPNPQPDTATVASTLTTPVTVLSNDTIGANPATTTNGIVNLVTPLAIAGLTVNAAAQIVVPPAAPGSYAIAYRLCNAAAPTICAQTTLSLTVALPVLVANADTVALPTAGGTATVLGNDTIDGIAATSSNVVTTITASGGLTGLTVNGAGAIVVPANAAGSYTIGYRICAVLAPTTCANSTATLTLAPVLVAANDSASLATSGGVVTVLGNDTVDGVTATTATVVVTILTTGGLAGVSVNAAGALAVPAFTAGVYAVNYRICSVSVATACSTAVATITLVPTVIANNDAANLSTAGGAVTVLANDTIDGVAATVANATVSIVSNGGLTGVSVNAASGVLAVPAFTAGTYVVAYRVCATVSPTTCATATASVTLTTALVLVNDTASLPSAGGTVPVLANDTINGVAANSGNVSVTIVSNGGLVGLTVNGSGALVVTTNPAATYGVTYRVCDLLSPTQCANATASITVAALAVVAVNDVASVPITGGTAVVLANDTIGAQPASASNVSVTIATSGGLTGLTVNAAGAIVVPANTTGNYVATYRICDQITPTNCATATATITVGTAAIAVSASNDSVTLATTTGGIVSVLSNDTVDGVTATTATVVVTILTTGGLAGVSVNAAGALAVPAFTAGVYAVNYRICSVSVATACSTAVATITLVPTVIANNDAANLSTAGGAVTVLANDTIDGVAATVANATVSIVSNGGLTGVSVNAASGVLAVPAFTAGTYVVAYRVCATVSPTTCATATASVTLTTALVLVNDTASLPSAGGTVPVLANDTINGVAANSGNVSVTIVSNGGLVGLTVNGSGALVVTTNPAATYGVTYRVCDLLSPTQCANATASITVAALAVVAVNDVASVPITGGTAVVLANDTIGAQPASASNVSVTIATSGGLTGLTVNAAGAIVVPANTTGNYVATYRICDQITPTNCATATATITVGTAAIAVSASNDSVTLATSTGGLVSVLSNDTVGGVAATTVNGVVSLLGNGGLSGLAFNASGQLVAPSFAEGIYSASYRLCAAATPTSCATATALITLSPAVAATADNITLTSAGGVANVLANDRVDAAPASSANVSVTVLATDGLIGITVTAAGELLIPAASARRYDITYRICSRAVPTACAAALAAITLVPTISAVADNVTLPSVGGDIDVLGNDNVSGTAATAQNVTLVITASGGLNGLSVTPQGKIRVPLNASGSYQFTYRICVVSSSTCASAVVAVTINNPVILLVADTLAVPDAGGVLRVLANDLIAGAPATAGNALLSVVANGGLAGLTVNSNAEIAVPANEAGSYKVTYRVCARTTPTACADSSVAVTVTLTAVAMRLVDDVVVTTQFGTTFNVLANDTLAGRLIVASSFTLSLPNNGGVTALRLDDTGILTVPAVTTGVYLATYRACQKNLATNCAEAKVRITVTQVQGSTTEGPRRPPSVPGAAAATYTSSLGASSPAIFAQAIPSSAGAANSPLILGETRLGYGSSAAGGRFQSYRSDSAFEPFGAQFQYSGTGTLNYRWEIVRPGEPIPDVIDLYPEPSLSLPDRLRQTRYSEIARGQVFLPALGRYFLRGPDPDALPRSSEGNYLILLRIEASTASVSGGLNGASAFPIQPLTYVLVGDRGVTTTQRVEPDTRSPDVQAAAERRRLGGRSSAAEFSNMGQLPDAGPGLGGGALRFRPQGEAWKTLQPRTLEVVGASIQQGGTIRLSWKPADNTALYRVLIEPTYAAVSLTTPTIVVLARSGSESGFELSRHALGAFAGLPQDASLRWQVVAYSADGKVVAISDWSVLKR